MNLGIEDAWVFAELAVADRSHEYSRLRRPVDQAVVRRVEMLSRLAMAETPLLQFARDWVMPTATRVPVVRSRIARTLSGLDHPLPDVAAVAPDVGLAKEAVGASAVGASSVGASAVGASARGIRAVGALAVGALAIGALAVGALAIGRLVIGRLAVREARVRSLDLDEVAVKRLRVGEIVITDALRTPNGVR